LVLAGEKNFEERRHSVFLPSSLSSSEVQLLVDPLEPCALRHAPVNKGKQWIHEL